MTTKQTTFKSYIHVSCINTRLCGNNYRFFVISVCLQDTLEAVIGGSVVLLCSSTKHGLKQDMNVHWRQNGSIYIYDIIKGKDSMAEQDMTALLSDSFVCTGIMCKFEM